jgi:hypothetical protein
MQSGAVPSGVKCRVQCSAVEGKSIVNRTQAGVQAGGRGSSRADGRQWGSLAGEMQWWSGCWSTGQEGADLSTVGSRTGLLNSAGLSRHTKRFNTTSKLSTGPVLH